MIFCTLFDLYYLAQGITMIDSLLKVNSIDLKFDPHSNIMKDNNYSKLDLLKMDIEGAEHEVIDHIQKNNIDIKKILVEFHPHFEKDLKKENRKSN